MFIRFWGVRGSIPVASRSTVKYGGNTPCVEIEQDTEPLIILEGGTGIRELGKKIIKNNDLKEIHILISHTHWDHILGLPFFAPLYIKDYTIHIYGPRHPDKNMEERALRPLEYSYFPVSAIQLQAKLIFHDLVEEQFTIGKTKIKTMFVNHPVFTLGYRIENEEGKVLAYTGDNEPYWDFIASHDSQMKGRSEGNEVEDFVTICNKRYYDFYYHADLLICDAQYTDEEYQLKRGWGHSSFSQALELAVNADVKKLVFFHHDPDRSDKELTAIVKKMREDVKQRKLKIKIFAATELKGFKL